MIQVIKSENYNYKDNLTQSIVYEGEDYRQAQIVFNGTVDIFCKDKFFKAIDKKEIDTGDNIYDDPKHYTMKSSDTYFELRNNKTGDSIFNVFIKFGI